MLQRFPRHPDRAGSELRIRSGDFVAAINTALRNVPRERVRLHVCWGNYEGPHHLDVPLEDIYDEIGKIEAGALMLSMANPRHAHDYHCFERRR